jgi:CHAT domain-containing protein/tetratricopeptide (TPR) repeat protein
MVVSFNVCAQQGSIEEARRLETRVGALYRQASYQEAITLEQRALAIVEKVRGPEHPDTALSLNNLAELYQATGAYAKAQPLLERALAIREKVLGPEHPDTATSLNNLAGLYKATSAYAKAEPLYQRALSIREKILGPDHPEVATSLNNLAALYDDTGAYGKAEPLYQRALTIREKVLGFEHPEVATSLNNLALLYRDTGAYAKAEPLYLRALAINEKALGPEHPVTALSLSNLAGLYDATGAYAKAEPLYQRALAIREKSLGPEHPDTAQSLDDLGSLYVTAGAHAKAKPLLERALALRERALGTDHPGTAVSLSHLARLYRATGAYAKAEPLYQRALAINEKALGPEHPETAASLNNLAMLLTATGVYAKAEPLLERALAINEKALGSEHPDTASALDNLAGLYEAAGAHAKAEPLRERALAINEKALGPEHPDTAISLNNLAELYEATGAYAKAGPLLERALAINEKTFGPKHPGTAFSLNNLAELYEATGSYAKAEPLLERALAIREKALGPGHPLAALSLNNLAELYEATGAYAKAKPLLERALAIREKALGSEHPDTANSLNNLAGLYHTTGEYAKAETLLERVLKILETTHGPEHPLTALSLSNLAALYHTTGAYGKAESLMERVQAIEEGNTQRFLLSSSEARQLAYLRLRWAHTLAAVSFSVDNPTAQSTELGLISVLQYKGRVLDSISGSAARLRRSVAPQDRAVFDRLSNVAQELSTLIFSPPRTLSSEDLRDRSLALAQEQEQLQAQLSSRSAELLQAVTPITLESVRQSLPLDAVLLEWFRYEHFEPKRLDWSAPRYVVFLLRRTGEPIEIDLGPAQPIESLVAEYRNALSDPTTTYYKEIAKELSDKLIKPLGPHLVQGERLLLCPDAALNLVPFAALVDEHGDYVLQHFELSYLASGRDLLRMAAEPPPGGSALVLADPSYGLKPSAGSIEESGLQPTRSRDLDRSGLVFTSLPGTAAEAKALRSLLRLDAQNVLTGDRATEARLKQLHGPRILHLATHAFFLSDPEAAAPLKPFEPGRNTPLSLGENPLLRSGLALAGANTRRSGTIDDGILSGAEVAQLDLVGTQLAVLSACDTGVGTVQTGEGVYGLRRALVLAGAQAQVVSLWKVADAATRELMVDYYRRLLKGEGRSAALRASQRAMMANPARQHPYYWATFIPIGDWRPLIAVHATRVVRPTAAEE